MFVDQAQVPQLLEPVRIVTRQFDCRLALDDGPLQLQTGRQADRLAAFEQFAKDLAGISRRPLEPERPQHLSNLGARYLHANDALSVFGRDADNAQLGVVFGLQFLPQRNDRPGNNADFARFNFRHQAVLPNPPGSSLIGADHTISRVQLLLADIGSSRPSRFPHRVCRERSPVGRIGVPSGLKRQNEIAPGLVTKEGAVVRFAQPVGPFEGNFVARPVDLQGIEDRLSARDLVAMDHRGRFGHPDGKGLDVGHALIEGAARFGVAHRLVEQVREVVEQGVLLFNFKGQNAVEKPGNVVLIFLADSFNAILDHQQPDVPKRLPGIFEASHSFLCQYPLIEQAQGRFALLGLEVVSCPVAIVGGSSISFGQCPKAGEPARNGRAEAFLAAKFRAQEHILGRLGLVAAMGAAEALHLLVGAPAQLKRDVNPPLMIAGAIRSMERNSK